MKTIKEKILNYDTVAETPIIDLATVLTMLIGTEKNTEVVNTLANLGAKKISSLTVSELISNGLTETQAIKLHSATLFHKKVLEDKAQNRFTIRSPQDAATYLMPHLSNLNQEHFVVLFLNVKNEIIHRETVFIGSLNASIVHPREIFKTAVKYSAASIICSHNHPSGNPSPSPEDIEVTKRLQDAGLIMGVELLDHVVIGDSQFVSLKEKGYM
ncbi:RadC family protein [Rummeliibacillus pycnus]|uniref:RadC family protein n=1 Tax=Rummeliibacillus pycnus TaxID=101070 RepID=UPI003D2BBA62